jgi:pyruvate carboxylase
MQVFKGYKEHQAIYGDTYMLPTRLFLAPLPLGKEVEVDIAPGKGRYFSMSSCAASRVILRLPSLRTCSLLYSS